MATLLDLATANSVFKMDPQLELGVQEDRLIYMSPGLKTWVETDLPTLQSVWEIQESPTQQLDSLVEVFCSGDVLMFGKHFKPLNHIRHGTWELKTADLRIIGWFARKDCFLGVFANDATYIKQHGLYHGYIMQTVLFRDNLDLDEPKFVQGDDPHAVVSNFSYP